MRPIRMLVSFALVMAWAAAAQAQDFPVRQLSLQLGAMLSAGSGQEVGSAAGDELVLKQGTGFLIGAGYAHKPEEGGWGAQLRGYHFGTSAATLTGVADHGQLILWDVRPEIQLFCSPMSDCTRGKASYSVSGSESRTRLDFMIGPSWTGDVIRFGVFGGLAYLRNSQEDRQSGSWQFVIFDRPSGVGINEMQDISVDSDVRLTAVGPTVGAEVEFCLGPVLMSLRSQGSFFFGSGQGEGRFSLIKDGSLTTTPDQRLFRFSADNPLNARSEVSPTELDLGLTASFPFSENYSLGGNIGFVGLYGLPGVRYSAQGRAAMFGSWEATKTSSKHVRLAAVFSRNW